MAQRKRAANGSQNKEPAKPRRKQPFPDQSINAARAFEAALELADLRTQRNVGIEDFERAYHATSRRPKAKLNDPEFLRAQLEQLTGQRVELINNEPAREEFAAAERGQ